MKTFKITEGDLVFDGQNNIVMVEDKEEEAQSIERVLSTNLNEWFLNTTHGMDYLVLQSKQLDEDKLRLAVIDAISQDPRIVEVEELKINFIRQQRKLFIEFTAKKSSGEPLTSREVFDIA